MVAIPRLRGIDAALLQPLAHDCQSIIFIVVVVNLLLQGLTLPLFCRFLNLSSDPADHPNPNPNTAQPG